MSRAFRLGRAAPALALLVPLLAVPVPAAASGPADDVPDAEGLAAELDALVEAHPETARVLPLGATRSGLPLEALVVARGEMPLTERQGVLVVAGLDGRRAADGRVVLEAASALLGRDDLAERLGDRALVLVPRANPEGLAALRGEVGPVHEVAGNRVPDDADRDGRVDEDGVEDLDGDGLVTWMRIPDAEGEWVVDEHDPRALRKAKTTQGERGTHRVAREGRDADGDGTLHEDGDEGVQPDRNFPHRWAEFAPEAGPFPLSEPEAFVLARFLLHHHGFGAVVVLGADDTLVSPPQADKKPSRGRFGGGFAAPLSGLLEDDVVTMREWGRRFDDIEPGHDVKGGGMQDGSFLAWSYHQAGRWPLGVATWKPPEDFPKDEPAGDESAGGEGERDGDRAAGRGAYEDGTSGEGAADDGRDAGAEVSAGPLEDAGGGEASGGFAADDEEARADAGDEGGDDEEDDRDEPSTHPDSPAPAALLAHLDRDGRDDAFVPWAPFEHPELGTVEIGGLVPGVLHAPPFSELADLTATLSAFLLEAVELLPLVAFEDLEVTDHGSGVYGVEVALVNVSAMPTSPAFAAEARLARPVRVTLDAPPGVERVHGPRQVLVDRLAAGGDRRTFRWTVAGAAPGVVLTLAADADVVPDLVLEVTLP